MVLKMQPEPYWVQRLSCSPWSQQFESLHRIAFVVYSFFLHECSTAFTILIVILMIRLAYRILVYHLENDQSHYTCHVITRVAVVLITLLLAAATSWFWLS